MRTPTSWPSAMAGTATRLRARSRARHGDLAPGAHLAEVLVRAPAPADHAALVGVEWFSVDPDQDEATDDGRPSVLGAPFDGPMAGHEPGMPVHFDLHAWIWTHNPAGRFAAWNPDGSCDS